jgi:hypothetical protein
MWRGDVSFATFMCFEQGQRDCPFVLFLPSLFFGSVFSGAKLIRATFFSGLEPSPCHTFLPPPAHVMRKITGSVKIYHKFCYNSNSGR